MSIRGLLLVLVLVTGPVLPAAETSTSRWGIGMSVVEAQGGLGDGDGQRNAGSVSITDDGMTWHEYEEGKRRQGHRDFHVGGLAREYVLRLCVSQSRQADGTWKTDYTGVGMPRPIEGNWYHGGFFRVHANARQLLQASDPVVSVVETGRQGLLDFAWDHALARLRVRFVLRPDSDHLLMEVCWEPTPELKTLTLDFTCYPEGFRVSEPDRLDGLSLDRHMLTAEREVQQVAKVDLSVATEWWQFYQDNTLEKSPTYGPGGCALAFVPEEVENATADIGGYTVSVAVTPRLATGRARFALWDCNGTANATALEALRAAAPAVRAAMTNEPWLPTAISGFSPAAESARLEALARALGRSGTATVEALRGQAAAIDRQHREFLANRAFAGEADLRHTIGAYRLACWQAERPTIGTVRILFLAGPWAYAWRLDDAARRQWGAAAVRQGGFIWKYWAGNFLTYFPATQEELLGYDVAVLADLPQDPFTEDKRQRLADYVRNGGGLLVLGGMYSGGAGQWQGSPLESLLPVQMGDAFDLEPSGAEVALTRRGRRSLGKVTGALGITPWRVDVSPRPGAEVWLTAGKEPFAVYAPAGAGRVVYILGTVYGEAAVGRTAFWEAPGWPDLAVRLLDWLARARVEPR